MAQQLFVSKIVKVSVPLQISMMPDEWFSQKEEVPYLYLSANPWSCTCSLGYLRRYLDGYEYNVYVRDGPDIKIDVESVVCTTNRKIKQIQTHLKEHKDCGHFWFCTVAINFLKSNKSLVNHLGFRL